MFGRRDVLVKILRGSLTRSRIGRASMRFAPDLLREPSGLLGGRDSKLAAQNAGALLILTKRGLSASRARIESHERRMRPLEQRIEHEEPLRDRDLARALIGARVPPADLG